MSDPRPIDGLDPAMQSETFERRHVGPDDGQIAQMLDALGHDSLEALMAAAVPVAIRTEEPLGLGPGPQRGRGAR